MTSTFYPLGYVAFLAVPRESGDINGILLAQAIAYACYVVFCYVALRARLSPLRSALGASLAALLPQSVVAMRHIGDAAITLHCLLRLWPRSCGFVKDSRPHASSAWLFPSDGS